VNYSTVAEETKNFVRDQSVSLIETLAERLASHLLKSFPIQKVTIELRKFVLQDAKYVSVTVTRTASVG
jgi:dihydroneopterin aldolase